ncbi:MAG: type IV pilin protein [Zoogloeaceae bacterium]|nr:type IV pilin protein [Zoogloeaceae bacterium]
MAALPLYTSQMLKARRMECESVLLQIAHVLERRHAATGRYSRGISVDFGSAKCPAEGAALYYDVKGSISPTDYTLVATPVGIQTKDQCKVLTLIEDESDHKMHKMAKHLSHDDPFSQRCWRQTATEEEKEVPPPPILPPVFLPKIE